MDSETKFRRDNNYKNVLRRQEIMAKNDHQRPEGTRDKHFLKALRRFSKPDAKIIGVSSLQSLSGVYHQVIYTW